MKKQILILALALIVMCGLTTISAEMIREKGTISLTWDNYPNTPQDFSGTISGDLTGTIRVNPSQTFYDGTSTTVGVTYAEITGTIDGEDCEGFLFGSNVNLGRDTGTFTLKCGDNTMIQGGMLGINTAYGNMDITYDAFKINPIVGATGPQGEQGIQGESGKDGLNGKDGLPGEKGDKGDTGEQGIQGIQGIQGEQGLKGDKGDTGTCTCDLTECNALIVNMQNYPGFTDFWAWVNSQDKCINGQLRCLGNDVQKCVNYAWTTQQSCSLGCVNGVCNQPPVTKEDCTKKTGLKEGFYCSGRYSYFYYYTGTCQYGQGTCTSCNLGKCQKTLKSVYCGSGCKPSTGKC